MTSTILRLLRVVVGCTMLVILPTWGTLDQHVSPVLQHPIHFLHWVGIAAAIALMASANSKLQLTWTGQDQLFVGSAVLLVFSFQAGNWTALWTY